MRKPSTDREQEPLSFRRTILGGILLAVQVISVELPSSQWSQQTTPPDLTHAQLPHSCFLLQTHSGAPGWDPFCLDWEFLPHQVSWHCSPVQSYLRPMHLWVLAYYLLLCTVLTCLLNKATVLQWWEPTGRLLKGGENL